MELKLTKIKGNLRGLTLFKGTRLPTGLISFLCFRQTRAPGGWRQRKRRRVPSCYP